MRREPERPTPRSITCFYMDRQGKRGLVARRVEVGLTWKQCTHFDIWEPQLLHKSRAERIIAWGARNDA